MHFIYISFCLLRLILTLFPEFGYIHPDEFFQGQEIVYGDLLQIKSLKTWEFTSSKPVRSVIFPFLTTGFTCLVADSTGIFSSVFGKYLHSYLLLVLPRLFMLCLSFITDLLIFRICKLEQQNPSDCLIMYASSYVTLTYLIRPLSNSLEMLFFSVLLFIIFKNLKYFSLNASVIKNANNCFKTYFITGLILGFGTFNRPTFLAYSFFPIICLFFSNKKVSFREFSCNSIYFLFGALSSSICICFLDTSYYNKWHYSKVNFEYFKISNIIITPLNFILYNVNTENLSSHGLHPFYLHLLVNIPLLFSVCGLCLIFIILQYLKKLLKNPCIALNINKYFIFYSLLFPLCILSFIPHQEPRFIIPLFFPLIILTQQIFRNKTCRILWFISNSLCLVFYGFFHQGGVYLSSSYLHGVLQNSNNTAVVFYKTYMPPRFLLGIRKDDISIYDFAGMDEQKFLTSLHNLEQRNLDNIFVVIPFGVLKVLDNSTNIFKSYMMIERKSNFPHLSTEMLPNSSEFKFLFDSNKSLFLKIFELKEIFSLHILNYKKIKHIESNMS